MAGQPRHLDGVPLLGEGGAHGLMENGEPVKPWLRSTPILLPAGELRSSGEGQGIGGSAALGHARILPYHAARCQGPTRRVGLGCAAGWPLRAQPIRSGREGVGLLYWFMKWIALGPWLRIVFRPHIEGAENVPASGPAILASNHLSYTDWMFMPLTLPRRVTFVAKAEYFTTPGLKGWFQKKFFSGAGQVPIDRSGASAAEGALSSARTILEHGDLFGIYPEGTRSHDGRLYRGKTGVARLALETGAPVIPVAVLGTDVVAPPGKTFGTFTRPGVRFGKPLDFSRYEGMENDRYILRAITDEIMYEIMQLSGQEYVDLYATKAKELSQKSAAEAKRAEREAREELAADSGEQKQAS